MLGVTQVDDAIYPNTTRATGSAAEVRKDMVNAQQVVRRVVAGTKAVVTEYDVSAIVTLYQRGKALYGLFVNKGRLTLIAGFDF